MKRAVESATFIGSIVIGLCAGCPQAGFDDVKYDSTASIDTFEKSTEKYKVAYSATVYRITPVGELTKTDTVVGYYRDHPDGVSGHFINTSKEQAQLATLTVPLVDRSMVSATLEGEGPKDYLIDSSWWGDRGITFVFPYTDSDASPRPASKVGYKGDGPFVQITYSDGYGQATGIPGQVNDVLLINKTSPMAFLTTPYLDQSESASKSMWVVAPHHLIKSRITVRSMASGEVITGLSRKNIIIANRSPRVQEIGNGVYDVEHYASDPTKFASGSVKLAVNPPSYPKVWWWW